AEQHRLVVVVQVVPRDGDEVGATLDVDQAVVAVGQIVMVDPDVGGARLHVDRVVIGILEDQVPDDHVLDTGEVEAAAGDARAGADTQNGLVGSDAVHPGDRDQAGDL